MKSAASIAFSEIKEVVTFKFIFTAQQSVHVDTNDIVAALTTAFGLPGLYWTYFLDFTNQSIQH